MNENNSVVGLQKKNIIIILLMYFVCCCCINSMFIVVVAITLSSDDEYKYEYVCGLTIPNKRGRRLSLSAPNPRYIASVFPSV